MHVPPNHSPASRSERTCVACRTKAAPTELVRVVKGDDGRPQLDVGRRARGRGAWMHPTLTCVTRAARVGLARGLRGSVPVTASELWDVLRAASDRKARSLLHAGRRAGQVVAALPTDGGADMTAAAPLVVVAADAPEAASTAWIEQAVRDGRAVAWGSRARLGEAMSCRDVTVAAVLNEGLARALAHAVRVAQTPAPSQGSRNVEVDASTEDR